MGLPAGIGRNEILFSLKAFVAAVAALWIALALNLQKPYWAMATAYIVMQPMAAAVTSKAVYRVLGTVLGAAMAVLLVPNLVQAPELLCLALAVWVGGCLFVSLLDRTPRSYVAMLAGYTGAIISFLSVSAPEGVFDTALSRAQEITIGIVCAAIVARLVMPRHLGPQLAGRMDGWMADAGRWAGDVLLVRDATLSEQDRRRLAADLVEMRALTTHLPYDTSELRHVAGRARALEAQMTALLPVLSSLEDRLAALRGPGGAAPLPEPLQAVLEAVAGWIAGGPGTAEDLIARIAAERAGRMAAPRLNWEDVLILSLLTRLNDVVEIWANAVALRADMASGHTRRPRFRQMMARYAGSPQGSSRSRLVQAGPAPADPAGAALAAVAVGLGILVCCAFWIFTGWHEGAGAAQMAAIFLSLFAVMDNPVPAMRLFARYTLYATAVVGVMQFAVLPYADSFLELVVLCAPFLLVFGTLMATPRWGPLGFLMCVNLPLVTMLDMRPTQDFAAFVNTNTASMIGILVATVTASMLTAIGAERGIARLLGANRRDLARITGVSNAGRPALVRRVVDRFGLLAQRLAAARTPPRAGDGLRDLRVALNMNDLAHARGELAPAMRMEVDGLLAALATHFRTPAAAALPAPLPPAVARMDRLLARLAERGRPSAAEVSVLGAMVGLRQALAPTLQAPPLAPLPQGPGQPAWRPAA